MEWTPLLSGLIALVTALIVVIAERRNADRWRFAEQKRTLYVDLLIEAEKHFKLLDAQTGEGSAYLRGERAEQPKATIPPSTPVEVARDSIRLVGPEQVVKAADRLFDSIVDLGAKHAWQTGQTVDPRGSEWDGRLVVYYTAKRDFTSEARSDLVAPTLPWWRRVLARLGVSRASG